MELSVVILTWNSRADIKQCLDSLIIATSDIECEIIVVDNGSSDLSTDILKQYGNKIILTLLPKNIGVARGRNVALHQASGEYILILDIDTIVNVEAITGVLQYLREHQQCGMCSCRLISPQGEIQDSCRQLPYPWYKLLNVMYSATSDRVQWLNHIIRWLNKSQFYRSQLTGTLPFSPKYVIGAFQMFPRHILSSVGFLDESIFYGPEDADFCHRISRSNYSIICIPTLHIIHNYKRISNKKLTSPTAKAHIKGLLHFYNKLIRH